MVVGVDRPPEDGPPALRSARVAPLEPAAEPRRIGVDAVQGLQLLPVRRVDVTEERVEASCQRLGDVGPLPVRLLGRLGPLPQRLLRLGQELLGVVEQAVVGQGDAGRTPGRELAQRVERLVQVEVGWWGRRAQHPAVGQLDADGVAGEEHSARASRAGPRGAWRAPASRPPPGASGSDVDLLPVVRARGGARAASGRGDRRGSRAAARRRGPPSRSGGSGRPGAGLPSRARRPWPRERPGPRRRRRRRGRGGCG